MLDAPPFCILHSAFYLRNCAWWPPGILVAILPTQRPMKARKGLWFAPSSVAELRRVESSGLTDGQSRNPSTLRSSATEDAQSEPGPKPGFQVCSPSPYERHPLMQTSDTSRSDATPRPRSASVEYLRRHAGPGQDSNPAKSCRKQLPVAVDAVQAGLRQVEPLDDGGQRIDAAVGAAERVEKAGQDRSWQSATMTARQLGHKTRPQRGYPAKALRRHFSSNDDGN